MSEEKEWELQEAKVKTIGDKEHCQACLKADTGVNKTYEKSTKIKAAYTDVYGNEGQEFLKTQGVKEGEDADIPFIQACQTWVNKKTGEKKTGCKVVNEYKEDSWKDIDSNELPDELTIDL